MATDTTDTARATLLESGAGFAVARERAERARLALHAAIRAAAAAGVSEAECARVAGVTRMTVRAALGKGPRR